MINYGTREHAAMITEGRHPGVRDALQWLTFSHLPEPLQVYSQSFYMAAVDLIEVVRTDSPELTTSLNKIIEAKDSAVRAGIRHDTGRAGSVPRPQEVVDPPIFQDATGRVMMRDADPEPVLGAGDDRPLESPNQADEGTLATGLGDALIEIEDVSDGYHTFGELYDHRRALTAALSRGLRYESWRSKAHHPGGDPIFDGYFIVGINLPIVGPITYHYKLKYWDDFAHVVELDHAPLWDGALPSETVDRLFAWSRLPDGPTPIRDDPQA
ncbi:MAG TPA: hypothetical protein VFT95_18565 [Micromonosporaceae bacterium]|nr:hypothetical protein [Micromonosporaceae bacterium]